MAEHGVALPEAEHVIRNGFDQRESNWSDPTNDVVRGYTAAGRYLIVVVHYVADADPVYPVTAYYPEEI